MVRIHPDPPNIWGCSSVGRAPALQAGGRRFDPVQLHQFEAGEAFRGKEEEPETIGKPLGLPLVFSQT